MRQLVFDLASAPAPSLENFVPGPNLELLARLRELAAGRAPDSILYLWGEAATGKSHLLAGCARPGVHCADDVHALDEPGQVALFHRINEARQGAGPVLAAGNAPPAALPLREDLRSRLGWGLVYQVRPPDDAERARYLRDEASRRGMPLGDEVIDYLLARVRRDLRSLAAILERLDRASLEQGRRITLPLVREALRDPDA